MKFFKFQAPPALSCPSKGADLPHVAPREPFPPQSPAEHGGIEQSSTVLPARLPGETHSSSACTAQTPGHGWNSLLAANTPEITLNTNQVKVKANKNIYLQNVKTDNIVTGIYKGTHNRKERKLC